MADASRSSLPRGGGVDAPVVDTKLFPSELDETPKTRGARLLLAGRVLASDGLDLVLADAFATAEVELDAASDVLPGDLVTVSGTRAEGKLVAARVESLVRPTRPPAGLEVEPMAEPRSETERFVRLGVGQALVARTVALAAVRRFFGQRRFLEVDTPAMVPCPGLDVHLDAFGVEGAKAPRWLGTSPEYQLKRLLVGGVPRCFQLARCFRRGELGAQHNPEFTMLEWYRAFADVEEVVADTEALVRLVAQELGAWPTLEVDGREVQLDKPFARLSVCEAFARFADVPGDGALTLAETDEDRYFELLVTRVEPGLATLDVPVVLDGYPISQASLARPSPKDPRVAERFELYVGGVELSNGFGELTDPVEQRARFVRDQKQREAKGLPVYPLDERFLAALEEGLPPSAGNALGIDRLIALLLGASRIEHVMAFPEGWLG
jgi:lysyl-tRNA synthetase class 2